MATWSVRTKDGVRENVTIYQVQQLLRTGELGADTEVTQGEGWVRLAEVPALARFVPAASLAPTTDEVLSAHGLVLQRDVNGKAILPPADVIARLLETDASRDRTNTDRGRRWAVGVGLVVAWFFAIVTLYYVVARPGEPVLDPALVPKAASAPPPGVQTVQQIRRLDVPNERPLSRDLSPRPATAPNRP
jgi:hypothetical protein